MRGTNAHAGVFGGCGPVPGAHTDVCGWMPLQTAGGPSLLRVSLLHGRPPRILLGTRGLAVTYINIFIVLTIAFGRVQDPALFQFVHSIISLLEWYFVFGRLTYVSFDKQPKKSVTIINHTSKVTPVIPYRSMALPNFTNRFVGVGVRHEPKEAKADGSTEREPCCDRSVDGIHRVVPFIIGCCGAVPTAECFLGSRRHSDSIPYSLLTVNSMRRFLARPCSVSFDATGRVSPYPAD
jgi:hypothetical protein